MEDNLLQIITKYWTQILFVGGVIFAFANLKFQNQDQGKRICAIENVELIAIKKELKEKDTQWTQIQVQLKEIDTKLAFLLKKYDEQ